MCPNQPHAAALVPLSARSHAHLPHAITSSHLKPSGTPVQKGKAYRQKLLNDTNCRTHLPLSAPTRPYCQHAYERDLSISPTPCTHLHLCACHSCSCHAHGPHCSCMRAIHSLRTSPQRPISIHCCRGPRALSMDAKPSRRPRSGKLRAMFSVCECLFRPSSRPTL